MNSRAFIQREGVCEGVGSFQSRTYLLFWVLVLGYSQVGLCTEFLSLIVTMPMMTMTTTQFDSHRLLHFQPRGLKTNAKVKARGVFYCFPGLVTVVFSLVVPCREHAALTKCLAKRWKHLCVILARYIQWKQETRIHTEYSVVARRVIGPLPRNAPTSSDISSVLGTAGNENAHRVWRPAGLLVLCQEVRSHIETQVHATLIPSVLDTSLLHQY